MNIEIDPTETDKKIVQMLCRSNKPIPVQAIADEIKKSYDETLKHLEMIGKAKPIRFNPNFEPGGLLDVVFETGQHEAQFRKPS